MVFAWDPERSAGVRQTGSWLATGKVFITKFLLIFIFILVYHSFVLRIVIFLGIAILVFFVLEKNPLP